jgi:hypothetical protein
VSRRLAIRTALAVLALSGCVEHLVGPARTRDDFVRKARTTASDALSTVETVRLVAEAADDGKTFPPYASQSVSEQEDALADVAGDFGSVQPPDAASDDLRSELNELLGTAQDDIAAVRIALRRGQADGLRDVAAPLEHDAAELEAFLERNS